MEGTNRDIMISILIALTMPVIARQKTAYGPREFVFVLADVFHFETSQTGWLSAAPYLAMAIVLQFAGHAADWLLAKNIFSRTTIRKLFNCGAFLAQVRSNKVLKKTVLKHSTAGI